MREKHKNILRLVVMALCVFFATNWIYGRTQLSGWIPLPFSIVLLIGAAYHSFDLIGELLGASKTFVRQLGAVIVLISVVVSISALVIFSLSKAPDTVSATAEEIQLPAEGITATNDSVIEISDNAYKFGADEGSVVDLESLITRCQELVSNSPDRRVVILARHDVSYTRVIEVMDALTAAGISNLNFSTAAN